MLNRGEKSSRSAEWDTCHKAIRAREKRGTQLDHAEEDWTRAGEELARRGNMRGKRAYAGDRRDTWRDLVGWSLARGTHAERKQNPADARVRRTRAEERRCAQRARTRGNMRTPPDVWRTVTGEHWVPRPAARQRSTRGGSARGFSVLARGLSARLGELMGFGPNWAFLGLNFWVFLGKLAQIQLFSSKT